MERTMEGIFGLTDTYTAVGRINRIETASQNAQTESIISNTVNPDESADKYINDVNSAADILIGTTATERDNTISIQHKAYLKMLALSNLQPFAQNYFKNIDRKYPISGINWMQDLIMTDNILPIAETHPTFDGNIVGLANAAGPYSGDNALRGTINTVESKLETTKATLVFDFPTHAANGIIGTVGFSYCYSSSPIEIFKLHKEGMQGIILNIVTKNEKGTRYDSGSTFAYDYNSKKFIMRNNKLEVYSVDPANCSVTKIGVSKSTSRSHSALQYHGGKEYYKSYASNGWYIIEHDVIADTERVASTPIENFSADYPIAVRDEYLYWFEATNILKIKLSDLSLVEKKTVKGPIVSGMYITYCPLDDYLYYGFYKIKFDKYYQGNWAESDVEESYPKKFFEVPSYYSGNVTFTLKSADGLWLPCQATGGIVPSGYSSGDEYRIDLLKLTEYPANWATAMVLPEPIEKNQTQTMKVTYTFSYEDLWKTEGQN